MKHLQNQDRQIQTIRRISGVKSVESFKSIVSASILTILLFTCGCSTPFLPTDNEFLLHFPGTERKSDKIAGVLRPWERMELIKEKGEKGRSASDAQKEILILQLSQEYTRSNDPNIRRSSIDALGKITAGKPSPDVEKIYTIALHDEFLGAQVSTINALGIYCTENTRKFDNTAMRKFAADALIQTYRENAYSISPGAKKENENKKDIRLAVLRNLEKFNESPDILAVLGEALTGEKLDDGALQVSAMKALEKITGKEYGMNAEKWTAFLNYRQGKTTAAPEELSATERMPKLNIPMFQ